MTVSMPSIEVATIGGGPVLGLLGSVLEMLGIKGAHYTSPSQDAQRLACIITTSVMVGELSLLSALAARHLMRAHLVHNHLQANTPTSLRPVTPGRTTLSRRKVSFQIISMEFVSQVIKQLI